MKEEFVPLAKMICLCILPDDYENKGNDGDFFPLTLYPHRYIVKDYSVKDYSIKGYEARDNNWCRFFKALRVRRIDISRWLADTFSHRNNSKVMRNYILLESFNRLDKKILDIEKLGKLIANKALSTCLNTQDIRMFELITGISNPEIRNNGTKLERMLLQERFSHVLNDIKYLGNTKETTETTVNSLYESSTDCSSCSNFDIIG